MRTPSPLRPGDRLVVIAPSGPFDEEAFHTGIAWLRERYEVVYRDDIVSETGYLAGSDDRRLTELDAALDDPLARAIVCARGGYGATRLLPALDLARIHAAGKWLVGFSDATALHAAWAKAGVASIHGPMVAALGRRALQRGPWIEALEGKELNVAGTPHIEGAAVGRLVGGNLAVLAALFGTGYAPGVDRAILLFEDVNEPPYRVDRLLTTIKQNGWLDRAVGVAVGELHDYPLGPGGVRPIDVVHEWIRGFRGPVVTNLPIGHGDQNRPVRLGLPAHLNGSNGTLEQAAIRPSEP